MKFIDKKSNINTIKNHAEEFEQLGRNMLSEFGGKISDLIESNKELKELFAYFRNEYLEDLMKSIIAAITFHDMDYDDDDFNGLLEKSLDWNKNPFVIILIFCDNIHWWQRFAFGKVGEIKPTLSDMKFEVKQKEVNGKQGFRFNIYFIFDNLEGEILSNIKKDIEEIKKKFNLFNFKTLPFEANIEIIDKNRGVNCIIELTDQVVIADNL